VAHGLGNRNSHRPPVLHKQSDVFKDLNLSVKQSEAIKGFSPLLSWSHYRTLAQVEHKNERLFYEIEAAKEGWSVSALQRQIHTFLFARLLKSRDKMCSKKQ